MKKLALLTCCLFLWQFLLAQEIVVTGKITAADDKLPLPGVTIQVKGTNLGTLSDINGQYSISVERKDVLVFSFIGIKTQEITVTDQSVINVVLEPDIKMLTEVVAIGYGSVRKSDLTGSVASVKSEQLQKTPAAGIDQALQGRVAGVSVNAGSGQPGAAAEVRIRGIGTVNNSAPIYVVDGVILDNISFLNPNDIESTEILKDASATAIYGSRGANGVILISTIKGKNDGKSRISFNTYAGVQNRWNKLDLMQSKEFAETIIALNNVQSESNFYNNRGFNDWLSAYRTGNSPYYPVIKSNSNPDGYDYSTVETDWQDEVFQSNAFIQNYHLSIDGGSEKSTYAISASFFDQEGTIMGSDYSRITLRLNTTHQARKWLTVGQNLSLISSEGRNAMNNNASPGASILSAALAMAPWDPTHYAEGAVNRNGEDLSGQISASSNFRNVTNPFSMVKSSNPSDKVERWIGNVFLEIKPAKGLTFRSDVSLDLSNNRNKLFKSAYRYSDYDKADKNFLSSSMHRYSTIKYENILTYNLDLNKHSFTVMGGTTAEEYNYYTMGGSGASILNPKETNWYLNQTTDNRSLSSDNVDRTRMFSVLGRLHYAFGNRYLATMTYRADGTSKFPENTWGYFPSAALAWRVSEESWMKGIRNLDYLKLRIGWGQIGNEKIGGDSFLLTMFNTGPTFVDYVFGANQELANGATVLTYINKGGRWEVTEQVDVGVDFGLFNSRISATVDVFVRDTKEMLLNVKAPGHVGNRYDALANVGTVRNKGIEISLDHMHTIITSANPLKYNISGNVSFIDNELTALNGGARIYGDRTLTDKGLGLYTFWGYEYEGIYQTDEEALEHLYSHTASSIPYKAGDARYRDLNSDGKIDDEDKMDLGNPFPWLNYGINLGVDWMNFDLQVFFQGVYGNKIYNAVRERTEGTGTEASLSTSMRNVWSKENTNGDIPNPYKSVNFLTSSRFVESGAYLRLKNIQLGYTIPAAITKRAEIDRFRIYLSASNLFTFTNYTGYDPEIRSGVDYGNYPQSRTFMVGANINF